MQFSMQSGYYDNTSPNSLIGYVRLKNVFFAKQYGKIGWLRELQSNWSVEVQHYIKKNVRKLQTTDIIFSIQDYNNNNEN